MGESQRASKYEEQDESVQHGLLLLQNSLFNHCYSIELDQRGLSAVLDLESPCPVAAGTDGTRSHGLPRNFANNFFDVQTLVQAALLG